MLSPNADLIAVSPASLIKDLKGPHSMGPPSVSSVQNLLEKVGDLDILQFWSNMAFLTFTDLH